MLEKFLQSMSGVRRLKSSIWEPPESQDWSHLLNHALETQPAAEDLLETQEYKPCEPLETQLAAEDLLQTQVYQPGEDYLQTQVYTVTALMPPADTDKKLTGQLKKAAEDHLKATWRKQPKEPLEATKQKKHPLETTQLKPKWKKLRVAGDTGGTSGGEIVE